MDLKEWCKQVLANIVGTWLGSGGLGAVSGTVLAYLAEPPSWAYGLYIVGGILIGLLVLDLHKRQGERTNTISRNDAEFFTTTEERNATYPTSEIFKQGNEIYAYFLSGEGIFSPHAEYMQRVKRLILPNPEGVYASKLHTLLSDSDNPYVRIPPQIRTTTAMAKKAQTPVKWFDSYIGFSILICNPESEDGFVHFGLTVPLLKPQFQPLFRVKRKNHKEFFDDLYRSFLKFSDNCDEPSS